MKTGWLVNDCLTCIPGTKTFWHDLLEHIPGLIDKTNGYTEFSILPLIIEKSAHKEGLPDYIIRNATFFRRLYIDCKQISLLQDIYEGDIKLQQIDVCNNSDIVVFNSKFTYSHYREYVNGSQTKIIPLGVDFELFKPSGDILDEILPNSILFVGAANVYPKGFDVVKKLIDETDYNFCLVMKDDFKLDHPRVKVFNSVDHTTMVKIYNSCSLLLCTSVKETQHLATIEAGACDIPTVTTNVGALYDEPNGPWGMKATNYTDELNFILNNKSKFSPRVYFLEQDFDKKSCMNNWKVLIDSLY